MASRIDLSLCVALLAGCPPGPATSETNSGEGTADDSTGEDEVPAECLFAEVTRAGFTLDLGDWPVVGDTVVMDAPCEVTGAAPNIALSCVDEAEEVHAIALTIEADAPFVAPALAGPVRLAVVRPADAAIDAGAWTIRDEALGLRLAGNHGDEDQPMAVASFFAPLNVSIDEDACAEIFVDNCFSEQRLVIEARDAMGAQRVAHGQSTVLRSGHRLHVERSARTRAFEDPQDCPVDAATPRVHRFLIAAE